MKRILIVMLLPFTLFTHLHAEEADSIDIITPIVYPSFTNNSLSSNLKKEVESSLSKLKATAGKATNYDVVAAVKTKTNPYRKDLSIYFLSINDFDFFVDKIATEGKKTIIGDDLSDKNLIEYYDYLGNKLIGGIADKVLAAEGVNNPQRRSLWINKILAPFKGCISKSLNFLYDASLCLDTLSSSLAPSIGVALVYELSSSNLSSALSESMRAAFNKEEIAIYKTCLTKAPGASNDIKVCVLKAIKEGILKITNSKLSKIINLSASSSTSGTSIKNVVWPNYILCTQHVGTDPFEKKLINIQFIDCIDELVQNTGIELVKDKITNNNSINSNFTKIEVEKMSNENTEAFKNCVVNQKNQNIRNNGLLDTEKCKKLITNNITRNVVIKTLSQTAINSLKSDKTLGLKMSEESRNLLDLCWSNEQSDKERESCLRKTILAFSSGLAKIKLNTAIPDDLTNKKEIAESSLNELRTCFEKNLPINISEAKNLTAQTSLCTNKLTKDVAQKVAQQLIRTKSIEQKMSRSETEKMVTTLVDKAFVNCIGVAPTDNVISKCSGELRKSAALLLAEFKIRGSSEGKLSSSDTENLIKSLVKQKLYNCLGNIPSEEKLQECIGDLTKKATSVIVLSYQKKTIKEQLNTDMLPLKLVPVQAAFVACTEKTYSLREVSSAIDGCTKAYSLDFARILGTLRFNIVMTSVLGSEGYNDQKSMIDSILLTYHKCLYDLQYIKMEDNLLNKLTVCTDNFQESGVNLVTKTFNSLMSSKEKDDTTVKLKNELAAFIPCLGGLLPPSPYTEQTNNNVDSVLKPVAILVAQYIEYSPKDAKRTLEEIIAKLSSDLSDIASNMNSRKELIDLLYKNGALDQFIKSMIRAEVKKSFDEIPESEHLGDLEQSLLSKENFDKIFETEDGKTIKEMVMDRILKPLLMDNISRKSPIIDAAMNSVKMRVVKVLVYSPSFGEEIIKKGIQDKINDTDGFTRFFAKAIYGKGSLDWDKVRTTSKGLHAEKFIRENIILPKFNGKILASNTVQKNNAEAEKLVSDAIKGFE